MPVSDSGALVFESVGEEVASPLPVPPDVGRPDVNEAEAVPASASPPDSWPPEPPSNKPLLRVQPTATNTAATQTNLCIGQLQ